MSETNNTTKYNLGFSQRFKAAFGGVSALNYLPEVVSKTPGAAVNTVTNNLKYQPGVLFNQKNNISVLPKKEYKVEAMQKDEPRALSVFGTPMFDQIRVSNPVVYVFPLDPLVDFHHVKKFVETEVQGGEEVVELINIQSVSIKIRGILWDDGTGKYPEQQLRDLLAVYKKNSVLEVSSRIFNIHGINSIYIKDVSTPALEGFQDTQPYEIDCRSHIPVELVLLDS